MGVRRLGFLLCAALAACTPSRKELGNAYRVPLPTNLKTFDPVQCSDQYSMVCQQQVYETLYQYKYLARPYDVEPLLAEAPPEVGDSGRVYRIRLKRGIRFIDDPCFPGGKGREVKASDFVYSIKRMADERNKTTGWWIFEGKIVGLDAFRGASTSLPPLEDSIHPALYDRPVEGLRDLDDSTVQIILTKPFPYFKYILAMPYAAVVAREAVERYQVEFMNHPVGTGPFILREWRHGLRLRFDRNPGYHHDFFPAEGTHADSLRGLLADAGKPLPFIDRLEFTIFEETQPMWLNFLRGNLDHSSIPKDNFDQIVSPDKALRGGYADKGLTLIPREELDLTYIALNMEDPFLGKHKKLRRAIALANDVDHIIKLFYNGQAIRARSPIPPGLFGYDSTFDNPSARHDLEAAKKLLAEAGFPGGKGLPEFEYLTQSNTTSRQMGEHFIQEMAAIGVRVRLEAVTWPEFLERLKKKKCQMAGAAWGADYPDPENFLQLLYGPNESPGENVSNYKNPEYDSLYVKMAVMQDTPERLAIIKRMKAILAEDCPWILETHRLREVLNYDWVGDFKPSAVIEMPAKYIKIDEALRRNRLAR
jgi:oligopeptide transport system substrate-binding protein